MLPSCLGVLSMLVVGQAAPEVGLCVEIISHTNLPADQGVALQGQLAQILRESGKRRDIREGCPKLRPTCVANQSCRDSTMERKSLSGMLLVTLWRVGPSVRITHRLYLPNSDPQVREAALTLKSLENPYAHTKLLEPLMEAIPPAPAPSPDLVQPRPPAEDPELPPPSPTVEPTPPTPEPPVEDPPLPVEDPPLPAEDPPLPAEAPPAPAEEIVATEVSILAGAVTTPPAVELVAESRAPEWMGVAKWVAAGLAVVFAGTGTYLGLDTVDRYRELEKLCPNKQCAAIPSLKSRRRTIRQRQRLTNLMWGASGVFAAAGVTLFVLDW